MNLLHPDLSALFFILVLFLITIILLSQLSSPLLSLLFVSPHVPLLIFNSHLLYPAPLILLSCYLFPTASVV